MPSPKETKSGKPTTERIETDPHRVFERLFDCYHYHEIADYLNTIKDWLINKEYPFSPGSREHDNTLFFFEKLLALVQAVQIFEEKRQANDVELKKVVSKTTPESFHALFDKVDALYDAALYLCERKQNALSCYILHKTVLCIYNTLLISTCRPIEETSDMDQLARSCSKIFNGLPNPFNPANLGNESLGGLTTITLKKAFASDFSFKDEQMEVLLRQVAIIRRDVCEYYERKIQRTGND